MCVPLVVLSPKFHSLLVYDKQFARNLQESLMQKKQHFEICIFRNITRSPNHPKMLLNTTRSNVTHICSTSNPQSQIPDICNLPVSHWPQYHFFVSFFISSLFFLINHQNVTFVQTVMGIPTDSCSNCSVLASFQPCVVFYYDCQSFTDGQGGKAPFPRCPAVFTSSKSVNY